MPYIGKSPVGGGFHKLDSLTASATATYALTLGGAAYYPETANQLLVSLNGVIQAPQDSFTVSGSNLVFASALTASDSIDFVVALGDVLGVGTPTDGTITTAKIANNAVTMDKLATSGTLPALDGSNLTNVSAGKVLQFASDQSANTSSGTTIPQDSTAPTISEGAEVFSISFTPTASTSSLLIQASFQLSSSANAKYCIWALFEDSTCIGAWSDHLDFSNNGMVASFNVVRSASSTSARTYSVRAGLTSGTIYIGDINTNNYGGLNANYMTIQEMGA